MSSAKEASLRISLMGIAGSPTGFLASSLAARPYSAVLPNLWKYQAASVRAEGATAKRLENQLTYQALIAPGGRCARAARTFSPCVCQRCLRVAASGRTQ